MTSNTLYCHICQDVLADNESLIKQHISSLHLNYWPYDCITCSENGNIFKTATVDAIDAHISTSHSSTNSEEYRVIKNKLKENELSAAVEKCRRLSILKLSSADATVASRLNSVPNGPVYGADNVLVPHMKAQLRKVYTLLDVTSTNNETGVTLTELKPGNISTSRKDVQLEPEIIQIDDDEEETEARPEHGQRDAASDDARKEREQNRNAPAISMVESSSGTTSSGSALANSRNSASVSLDAKPEQMSQDVTLENAQTGLNAPAIAETLPEAMHYPIDRLVFTDFQSTLLPVFNQQTDKNDEPMEEQEVTPYVDLSHLTSINLYPDVFSSIGIKSRCKSSTTDHFHGASENVQDSDVTTDKASDNGNNQLSQQNEVLSAVDSNASGSITATATLITTPTEIRPLNLSKVSNMHIEDNDSFVGTKRSRLSHTDQNLAQTPEDNTVIHTTVEAESQYGQERESDAKKFTSTTRVHDVRKETHRVINENKVQGHSRQKARPQLKKKSRINQHEVEAKRAVNEEKRLKCKMCHYATNYLCNFTIHMRRHTGERPFKCELCNYAASQYSDLIKHDRNHAGKKPYKCELCNYAAAQNSNLIRHIRRHTGEKPYKCSVCQFASSYSGSLKMHMRTEQHKAAMKLQEASSQKDAESNMLKKSGYNN